MYILFALKHKLLTKNGTEFIYRDIKKNWHPKKNEVVAYLNPTDRKIYIDFGSPLRKDEPPLEMMYSYDLGIYLIREADKLKEQAPVYAWTAYLIAFGEDVEAEELIEKYFNEIWKTGRPASYNDGRTVKYYKRTF